MSGHKKPPNPRRTPWSGACLFSIAFTVVLCSGTVGAAAPEKCRARLEVKLTPDVPNPRDPSFLSALAANPLYQLTWVSGTDSMAVYDLTGPATDYQCEEEIKRLRRDAHLMDLKVLHSDAEG